VIKTRRVGLGAATAVAGLVLAACGGGSSGGASSSKSVDVVAYSTPQKAYAALTSAFDKTPAGNGVKFSTSFASSGSQSRAVVAGQPADLVEFSLQTDMESVVKAGIVDPSWNQNATKGFVTDSVVTLVVRKGNPKGIRTWDDLIKPGVKVVTPNPLSSGSARWNLMAAYGAELKEGKTPAQALNFVKELLQHTVTQPDSGADATAAFVGGTGDVLISYENEAIGALQAGDKVQYITPPDTILIQNPIAVTKNASPAATAFLKYLYSPAGQATFARFGYRPVVPADFAKVKSKFPIPAQLFTIDSLGGWDSVASKFFDTDNGSITKIEQSLGQSSSG
jgi:sulfate transport system substrate-binding protein